MKVAVFVTALLAHALGAVLDVRRPACSEEGGLCNFKLFECCQNERLNCVSIESSS